MSLDVTRLRAVSNDYNMDIDSRCRSIARNALQASREAHGRGNALYTDDEAKRERMIEQILRLDMSKYEGHPNDGLLVAEVQPSNPLVNKVSEILERGLEAALAEPQAVEVVTATKPSRGSSKQ